MDEREGVEGDHSTYAWILPVCLEKLTLKGHMKREAQPSKQSPRLTAVSSSESIELPSQPTEL